MLWDKENEIDYWYSKIPKSIPTPRTIIIPVTMTWTKDGNSMEIKEEEYKEIEKFAEKFDVPLFIKGGVNSGKHDWEKTCFVTDKSKIREHLNALMEDTMLKDITCKSFALREFIPMNTGFYAFYGKMPVNSERRYFVKDGKLICHHPYWIEDAIRNPSINNWKEVLKELNKEADEVELLTKYAESIGKNLKGYWSIDFSKSKEGKWYCIDMALASDSWHPDCKFAVGKEGVK
jgi:hypothetical protein